MTGKSGYHNNLDDILSLALKACNSSASMNNKIIIFVFENAFKEFSGVTSFKFYQAVLVMF